MKKQTDADLGIVHFGGESKKERDAEDRWEEEREAEDRLEEDKCDSPTKILWERLGKWQEQWRAEKPKERKLTYNDALSLIEWKISQVVEEERKRVVDNLPEIKVSRLAIMLDDCPNCGQERNRSFIDDLTCRIQDEYKKKVLASLQDKDINR